MSTLDPGQTEERREGKLRGNEKMACTSLVDMHTAARDISPHSQLSLPLILSALQTGSMQCSLLTPLFTHTHAHTDNTEGQVWRQYVTHTLSLIQGLGLENIQISEA
jgi:hypothetical protein